MGNSPNIRDVTGYAVYRKAQVDPDLRARCRDLAEAARDAFAELLADHDERVGRTTQKGRILARYYADWVEKAARLMEDLG